MTFVGRSDLMSAERLSHSRNLRQLVREDEPLSAWGV